MTTYNEWIDRLQICIELFSELPYGETITMHFTMRDLIELKLIVETCKELAGKDYKI